MFDFSPRYWGVDKSVLQPLVSYSERIMSYTHRIDIFVALYETFIVRKLKLSIIIVARGVQLLNF